MVDKGRSMRTPLPEGEGEAETASDELFAADIPQDPVLLQGRRNYLDDVSQRTLNKFTDDTKLRKVVDVPDSEAASQTILNRLEKWINRNFMKFNIRKCQLLSRWS
ncbi:rna-directed dna polymerase from mobile element jockey-like [Pitangus sulphuratus]|nr:rna-directed dna polymerase from mobile element jockey-like [Pitangus sulphuratus]